MVNKYYYTSAFHTNAGTSHLVSNSNHKLLSVTSLFNQAGVLCHKDTGGRKLRKWSRGHQFIVRSGDHIDTWQPLKSDYTLIIQCEVRCVTVFSFRGQSHLPRFLTYCFSGLCP